MAVPSDFVGPTLFALIFWALLPLVAGYTTLAKAARLHEAGRGGFIRDFYVRLTAFAPLMWGVGVIYYGYSRGWLNSTWIVVAVAVSAAGFLLAPTPFYRDASRRVLAAVKASKRKTPPDSIAGTFE